MTRKVRKNKQALQAMERLICLPWVLGNDWRILSRRVCDLIHLLDHSGLLCREWILGKQEWKQGGQCEAFQVRDEVGLGQGDGSGED